MAARLLGLLSLALADEGGTGRTVLITGASKGIGRAVAQRFARGGHRVVVHFCSDAAGARETLRSLATSEAGHCVVQEDLAAHGGPERLVAAAAALVGRIDVLVCNHGIYEETPFDCASAEQWSGSFERVLRTNLAAPAELAFHVARHMVGAVDGRGGAIVFVSSRGARRGEPLAPAYGASKGGLNSLTGSLSQSFGEHGICVSAVAPGFISTAMATPVLAGPRGDGIREQSAWKRVGRPDEVAEAVFFLASEDATWCSGAVLDCNGASYLH
ncbi:hypothetical protein AB1Y20_023112 [Prymnesium parvum]|uniref:3-oxoacyl-[acyl-carrier-protein] reductase n=1 Tax=Prymnesium parvum TaxID=97485 RepID=A0AB34JEG6_PRYPA